MDTFKLGGGEGSVQGCGFLAPPPQKKKKKKKKNRLHKLAGVYVGVQMDSNCTKQN